MHEFSFTSMNEIDNSVKQNKPSKYSTNNNVGVKA